MTAIFGGKRPLDCPPTTIPLLELSLSDYPSLQQTSLVPERIEHVEMDESSRSSATLDVEQTQANHQHALPEHAAPKDVQETEANVLPDTSAESKELDLEKERQTRHPPNLPAQWIQVRSQMVDLKRGW